MADTREGQGVQFHVHTFPKGTLTRISLGMAWGFGFAIGASVGLSVVILWGKLFLWIGRALFA